jgi:hypothetical protein
MSIATLKKKSGATQFAKISAGPFSLNSSRRLEGHHQEPQIQTPFRGTGARRGGAAGTFRYQEIHLSQRVNYDPFNQQRPSIKSNQAHISKLMWPKPIVKLTGARNYGTYYTTINAKCDTDENNGGICETGYVKNLDLPSYENYQKTTLLKNNCISSKNIHLPVAGNGLQSARSC